MKTWMKVAIVTTLVAIPAFFSGPILFPPAEVGAEPTAAQMPFFLAVGDALLLGLGVSFVLFGLSVLKSVSPDSRLRAWVMYLSIGYLMILIIDYPFHLPLEVAGVVLAFCFLSLFTSYSSGKIAEATRKLSEEAVG